MKRAIALLVIIGLVLGCTYDDISKVTLHGTWTVVALRDLASGTVEYKTEENTYGGEIWVSFNDRSNPRKYDGKNISNSFFGSYMYVGQQKMKVLDGGRTEVGGNPPWEKLFNQAFYQAEVPFAIEQDSLTIYFSNRTKAFVLKRK